MIAILAECAERERLHLLPPGTYYSQSLRGLFDRGLVSAKEYNINGKQITKFQLTEEGRKYLQILLNEKYNSEKNYLNNKVVPEINLHSLLVNEYII
jgi:DNA-binding PadR family transcriptional regulator